MILVDSSVWIDHFRNVETEAVGKLRSIEREERLRMADLIRLELLIGSRDDAHAAAINRRLKSIPEVRLLDGVSIDECATNYRVLRSKGVKIRKSIDIIIGSFCIRNDYLLLHDDRDFTAMATHLDLKVY